MLNQMKFKNITRNSLVQQKSLFILCLHHNIQTEIEPVDLEKLFTGEEYYGKYIDLHSLYEDYVNLPHVSRVDYITFLSLFYKFKEIPMETKMSSVVIHFILAYPQRYSDYLTSLLDYLTSFFHRSQPLVDVDSMIEDIRGDFAKKWEAGQIEGWNLRSGIDKSIEEAKKKQAEAAEAKRKQQAMNINDIDDDDETPANETPSEEIPDYSSIESIEKLGADKLKEILQSMGAKCGYVNEY